MLWDRIRGRHFTQATERAGVSSTLAEEVLQEVLEQAPRAKEVLEKSLPEDFPEFLHGTIWKDLASRLGNMWPLLPFFYTFPLPTPSPRDRLPRWTSQATNIS